MRFTNFWCLRKKTRDLAMVFRADPPEMEEKAWLRAPHKITKQLSVVAVYQFAIGNHRRVTIAKKNHDRIFPPPEPGWLRRLAGGQVMNQANTGSAVEPQVGIGSGVDGRSTTLARNRKLRVGGTRQIEKERETISAPEGAEAGRYFQRSTL
jgi:hypothetical protein